MSPKSAASLRGIAALALLCAASPALAQQPTQAQPQKQHTVRKGDTLWDLARFYLSDPFRWPMIYEANRNVVENPHWIYPAERLLIPGLPGETAARAPIVEADVVEVALERSRFYAPTMASDTTRATLITSENARVPLVHPLEWLAAPWISASAPQAVATVMKPVDAKDSDDRLAQLFHPRDKMFLSTSGSVNKDDRLLMVRVTRNVEGRGWIIEPQGIVHVDSIAPNTAAGTVVNQFGDLKVGDLAIPLPQVPALPAEKLTAVTGGPTGEIIEMLVEQPLVATTDYAFVNLGASQGLAVGDELLAYVPRHKPKAGRPETLTEQAVAKLRVVHVTDRTATVRVMQVSHAAVEPGLSVRVAKKAS